MITNKLTGGFGAQQNGSQVLRAPDLSLKGYRVKTFLFFSLYKSLDFWFSPTISSSSHGGTLSLSGVGLPNYDRRSAFRRPRSGRACPTNGVLT